MAISKQKVEKKTCISCNRNISNKLNYYRINGNDPAYPDGYYPICKDCVRKLVQDEHSGYKSFIRILMSINRPFKEDLFAQVDYDYFAYLSKIAKHTKEEFIESDGFFSANDGKLDEHTVTLLTPEELHECQLFWGKGNYEEEDYVYLISRYEEYNSIYDIDSPAFKGLVAQICQLELDIRRKRMEGINTKDEAKVIQDLMKTAGIAPSQEKQALENNKESFGTLIRKFENEHPIPEPLDEFKDIDGIGKYVRTWFFSPMMKVFGKENPYMEEYLEAQAKYGISREQLLEDVAEHAEEDIL